MDAMGSNPTRLRFIGYTKNEGLDAPHSIVYGGDIGLSARAVAHGSSSLRDPLLAGARLSTRTWLRQSDVMNAGFGLGRVVRTRAGRV
jgi:hypothetical protein